MAAGTILIAGGLVGIYQLNDKPHAREAALGAEVDSIASSRTSVTDPDADLYSPVEGDAALLDTLVLAVSAAGLAAARREAMIIARVAGEILSIAREENTAVGAGGTLATIDAAEYELALKDAQARLRIAETTYRESTLFDDRIADVSVRTERQKNVRAKSGLDQAEVAVQKAKLDLARARVRAPFAGRVASVSMQSGQYARPGDVLMTIVDLSRIKVEVQVLEGQIGFLAPGHAARVHFAAFPNERFIGRIETINPIVDKDTRSARVVVSVTNPAGRILPGMYARVLLDARRFADRVLVPRSAILERDRRKLVFVFEPDEKDGTRGLAKWRYVTTGLENESRIEIIANEDTDMVRPGEIVLIAGHRTLVHDARVQLADKVIAGR